MNNTSNHIVFFDGICNLCNRSVAFIMKRDKKKVFKFSSLQSPLAQIMLKDIQAYSIVYIEDRKIYQHSTAVLKIAKHLSLPYSLGSVFLYIPQKWRDVVYRIIARNRYKWFGKSEYCAVPSESEKNRFLTATDLHQ